MRLLGLDHIAIVVRDINETVARAGATPLMAELVASVFSPATSTCNFCCSVKRAWS